MIASSASASAGSGKTASRVLDIFETFREARQPLTLTELASRMGSPMSSCHGLVKTLQARGYLYGLESRKVLYPTKRLFEVAQDLVAHDPLLDIIAGHMMRLRDVTRETVIVGKRQDDEVVYLEVCEGLNTIRYSSQAGDRKLLHSSAIGKALMSALPEDERDRLLRRLTLVPVTENTITSVEAMRTQLREAATRGYVVSHGENVVDVMALARPITVGGETIGVCVAGPLHRMESRVETFGAALIEACDELEREAGGGITARTT